MARPKKENPPTKERFIHVRVTEDLYDVIAKEAEEAADLKTTVPDLKGMTGNEAKTALFQAGLSAEIETEGEMVERQIPPAGETVNKGTKILLYFR